MTMISIRVLGAAPSAMTASPGVTFRLRVDTLSPGPVHAIALRCQTRIEPRGRQYAKEEQARLYELFGDVSQWERTLRSAAWGHTTALVPTFERQVEIDLPVACTYDMEVASAKYLHAVRDGDVPLAFLFSGSIFTAGPKGMTVEPVPWDLEATFRMPTTVWRAAMDRFFPGGGWIRLDRETIDRLQAFRGQHAVISWDETIELLLAHAQPESGLPV